MPTNQFSQHCAQAVGGWHAERTSGLCRAPVSRGWRAARVRVVRRALGSHCGLYFDT